MQYELQIATPNFENATQLVQDTLLVNTGFTQLLDDGNYEWRIRGLNEESTTDFTTTSFSVFTTVDLTTQDVTILAPISGTVLKDINVNFTWEALEGATSYELQVATPSFDRPEQIVVNAIFDNADTQTFELPDGVYGWRVRGLNANSQTPYTTADFEVNAGQGLANQEVILISPK